MILTEDHEFVAELVGVYQPTVGTLIWVDGTPEPYEVVSADLRVHNRDTVTSIVVVSKGELDGTIEIDWDALTDEELEALAGGASPSWDRPSEDALFRLAGEPT